MKTAIIRNIINAGSTKNVQGVAEDEKTAERQWTLAINMANTSAIVWPRQKYEEGLHYLGSKALKLQDCSGL